MGDVYRLSAHGPWSIAMIFNIQRVLHPSTFHFPQLSMKSIGFVDLECLKKGFICWHEIPACKYLELMYSDVSLSSFQLLAGKLFLLIELYGISWHLVRRPEFDHSNTWWRHPFGNSPTWQVSTSPPEAGETSDGITVNMGIPTWQRFMGNTMIHQWTSAFLFDVSSVEV